jgi:hypothetical protein
MQINLQAWDAAQQVLRPVAMQTILMGAALVVPLPASAQDQAANLYLTCKDLESTEGLRTCIGALVPRL